MNAATMMLTNDLTSMPNWCGLEFALPKCEISFSDKRYPAWVTALFRSVMFTMVSTIFTVAFSVARFTENYETPFTNDREASTLDTQAAHVIPCTLRIRSLVPNL